MVNERTSGRVESFLRSTRKLASGLPAWALPILVGGLVFCFLWRSEGNPARKIECFVYEQGVSPWLNTSHMFSCSNVRQAIHLEKSQNVKRLQTDVDGWEMWVAEDTTRPGLLCLTFVRDRQRMIFYPRLSGKDSSVGVYEGNPRGGLMRRLGYVAGQDNVWTNIGQQCSINTSCVEYGEQAKEFDVTLYFVLTGPWSQVWVKNQNILF